MIYSQRSFISFVCNCSNSYTINKVLRNLFLQDMANGFPKTCHEVQMSGGSEGYHTIDPEQDGIGPISVFCNMTSSPVTAVLHHNLESWTHVSGYEDAYSYNGQVGSMGTVGCE